MPTPLTITICLTLTLAITAGAFYWGYKVGVINKISSDNQARIDLAVKQIEEMAEHIEQLNYQIDSDKRDRSVPKTHNQSSWDPSNPLSPERR